MVKNQRQAVLQHLKTTGPLTSMEAFNLYGITRLSAIVFDLRKLGHTILTIECAGKTRYGNACMYAKYKLVEVSEDE